MKKLALLALVFLALVGCAAQCGSFWDGFSGQPMNVHTDLPAWYHFGALLLPVISQLVAILRIIWPLLIPLL